MSAASASGPNPPGRKPSGTAYPAVRPDQTGPQKLTPPEVRHVPIGEPLPVVLARGTFVKLSLLVFGGLVVTISAVLAVYWAHHYKTEAHMGNRAIHLTSGEREKLETKDEARTARKKMVVELKHHTDVRFREVRVEQQETFQKWSKGQSRKLDAVLEEVKKTRQDVKRSNGD